MSASFCWHCGNPLVGKNGTKTPPLIFAIVEPHPGQQVRVHKICLKDLNLKPVTAQPSAR